VSIVRLLVHAGEILMLRLAFCSYQAASFAVKAWHYSRSLPTPPLVRVGVWEYDQFVGVVLFSRGANRHLAKQFGLAQPEVCEMSRVALRQHEAPVSRILSIAVRLLRQQCPGLRLVVSFADPEQGHCGVIYQAAGWVYLGQSNPSTVYIDRRGRRWHPRMVSRHGIKRVYGELRRVVRSDDCTPVAVAGKHRYALPLDAETRARLAPLAQPYRKRERMADSGRPAPSGRDGASPIRSLQTDEGDRA
jgi:hypothetical protein